LYTGVGIREEDMGKMFKMFEKLDDTKNINANGCGLGLTVSKTLSQKLGGDISVRSKYGEGTVFEFVIDVKDFKEGEESEIGNISEIKSRKEEQSEDNSMAKFDFSEIDEKQEFKKIYFSKLTGFTKPTPKNLGSSTKTAEYSFTSPISTDRQLLVQKDACKCNTIIVVDDNVFNYVSIKFMLKNLKLECDTATNGKDALDMIVKSNNRTCECGPYKLVMTDLQMPIMNGHELCQHLMDKMKTQEIYNVHIVIMSGDAVGKQTDQLKKIGIQHFLPKPVFVDSVNEVLKKIEFI